MLYNLFCQLGMWVPLYFLTSTPVKYTKVLVFLILSLLSTHGRITRKHVIDTSSGESSDELRGELQTKKTKVTEKEDMQDTLKELMKEMLRVLCQKVDRNEKCLEELKTRSRLVVKCA